MPTENKIGRDSQPLRMFVAIRVPDFIRKQFYQWRLEHEQQFPFKKWTHQEDYHITLQFLGDVEPDGISNLTQILHNVASDFNPFSLQIGEWGTFGLQESPRVLWAGINAKGMDDPLFLLQQKITAATQEIGFVTEKRPYHPHITISRKYKGKEPFSYMDRNTVPEINNEGGKADTEATWHVNEFVLFVTHLHVQPMYEILKAFHLEDMKSE